MKSIQERLQIAVMGREGRGRLVIAHKSTGRKEGRKEDVYVCECMPCICVCLSTDDHVSTCH